MVISATEMERESVSGPGRTRRRWLRFLVAIALLGAVSVLAAGPTAYLDETTTRILLLLTVAGVVLALQLRRATTRRKTLWKIGCLAVILWWWVCLFLCFTGLDALFSHAPSPEVTLWAKRAAQPIPKLDVYEPRDWEFLRNVIGNRRIVMLGESNHCVEENSQAKFDMIRYLHEELGFSVLAFESYMVPAHLADLDLAASGTAKGAVSAIYSIWNTNTVRQLFEYVKRTKSSEAPMHIAGIDMKIMGDARQRESAFIYGVIESDTALAARYMRAQAHFGSGIYDRLQRGKIDSKAPLSIEFADFYDKLPGEIDRARSRGSLTAASATDIRLAAQVARILAVQPRYRDAKTVDGLALRDSLMASNMRFMVDEMYSDQKIIVWAHNAHIARAFSETVFSDLTLSKMGWLMDPSSRVKWMGEYISDWYGDDLYVIGLQAASGRYKTIDNEELRVRPLHRNSIEYLLCDPAVAATFLDFTRTTDPVGTNWRSSSSDVLVESSWHTMIPARQYNGVLVVSHATPPEK